MRITDVEPIVLRLDLIDTTRADGTQDAFLVRIHTDEGIVGVGEADTSPYLARTIVEMPSSHSIARGLKEVLVGEDPLQADRLWQLMFNASDHYGRGGAAWAEFSIAGSLLVNGILREPFELRDGRLAVPTGPGLGIELDEDALHSVRLA